MREIIEVIELIESIGVMLFKAYNAIEELVYESRHLDDNDKQELVRRIRESQEKIRKWDEL